MKLKEYQLEAINWSWGRLLEEQGAGLWLDCGLGKTAVVLHLILNMKVIEGLQRVLVIVPSSVLATDVWPNEINKWNLPLTIQPLNNNAKSRKDPFVVKGTNDLPDIHVISCDSIGWLEGKNQQYDMVVVDEVTKFKNWSSKRTKHLRKLLKSIKYRITLTGTPIPNNLLEIFPQQFILDNGKTLGTGVGDFRTRYAEPHGFELREWRIREECAPLLKDRIAPWYLHQSSLDHLDLPEVVENIIPVVLDKKAKDLYKDMLKRLASEISDSSQVTALTGSSKYSKLRQIASGTVIDDEEHVNVVHQSKIETLGNLIDELNGKPLMVAYCFRGEAQLLANHFNPWFINGDTSPNQDRKTVEAWKSGKLKLLAVNPAALSHGVDGLQFGGNDLCWFTLTDVPENKHQLQKRLHRQGVVGQVRFHYLIADNTVDQIIFDKLNEKDTKQNDILTAVRDYAIRFAKRSG